MQAAANLWHLCRRHRSHRTTAHHQRLQACLHNWAETKGSQVALAGQRDWKGQNELVLCSCWARGWAVGLVKPNVDSLRV